MEGISEGGERSGSDGTGWKKHYHFDLNARSQGTRDTTDRQRNLRPEMLSSGYCRGGCWSGRPASQRDACRRAPAAMLASWSLAALAMGPPD